MGWNLFHAVAHAFTDISNHVAALAEGTVGPMFGLPPGVGAALTKLIMHANAGDPKAKAALAKQSKERPQVKRAIMHLQDELRKHPRFREFIAHAKAHT